MKKTGLSHIRRWFWLYVFLVVMTTLAANIFVYGEINDLLSSAAKASQPDYAAHVGGLRLRIVLVLSAGLLAVAFFSVVWLRTAMRFIHRPIHSIQRAVLRLAQGKLNETLTVDSTDLFGQIGSSINELAANLQELLLYIWKQTGQCMALLEEIQTIHEAEEHERLSLAAEQHLQQLREAMESLREMAKSYVFYDVRLDGDKAMAVQQPGQKEPTDLPAN